MQNLIIFWKDSLYAQSLRGELLNLHIAFLNVKVRFIVAID